MEFSTPIVTNFGIDISAKLFFAGGKITFDAVCLGNDCDSENAQSLLGIKSKVMNADIFKYEKQGNNVTIYFSFDNSKLDEGFDWREYGVMATYTSVDGNEVKGLYCYGYDNSEQPESIPKFTGKNSYCKIKYNVTIGVSNADNVDVDLKEFTDFIPREEYEEHISAINPHGMTKEDIGLENVENVSVNDAQPTFEEATTLENIKSGEKAFILWGKVKKAITAFINHLAAVNPHGLTAKIIGAAEANHSHSATEITSGSLPITRGGTGSTTAANARKSLGVDAIYKKATYTSEKISFTSKSYETGSIKINSYTGYSPVAIADWQIVGDGTSGSHDGSVSLNNIFISGNTVGFHLVNRLESNNHCKFTVAVLYLKNL